MITPAQQHWQNVMAQRAGRANEGVDHAARTAHEEVLYRLRLAQARLKGVQARSAKAAIKKELLPDFSGWIEGTLEADGGQQDEVIATLMVWAIDCGDLPLALRIGAYVVHHNLIMPDNFGRTAATVLTEEICNPVLTQAGTDTDADLSAFIEPLDTLREIVT
ncbi:terminase, partial [Escherichia coli]|nr:terminase [Escherichia coli]